MSCRTMVAFRIRLSRLAWRSASRLPGLITERRLAHRPAQIWLRAQIADQIYQSPQRVRPRRTRPPQPQPIRVRPRLRPTPRRRLVPVSTLPTRVPGRGRKFHQYARPRAIPVRRRRPGMSRHPTETIRHPRPHIPHRHQAGVLLRRRIPRRHQAGVLLRPRPRILHRPGAVHRRPRPRHRLPAGQVRAATTGTTATIKSKHKAGSVGAPHAARLLSAAREL